ncbi:MAG: hypothetical protein ACKV0T_19595 [Planctomycetales bacterium]
MSQKELETRLAALELQVARLLSNQFSEPGPMDWQRTIGMSSGDELMKEIDAAGEAWRERDRQKARAKKRKPRRVKP